MTATAPAAEPLSEAEIADIELNHRYLDKVGIPDDPENPVRRALATIRALQAEAVGLREALKAQSYGGKAKCWCLIRDDKGDDTKDVFHSAQCIMARAALSSIAGVGQ